jgi:hypothetical protein
MIAILARIRTKRALPARTGLGRLLLSIAVIVLGIDILRSIVRLAGRAKSPERGRILRFPKLEDVQ